MYKYNIQPGRPLVRFNEYFTDSSPRRPRTVYTTDSERYIVCLCL